MDDSYWIRLHIEANWQTFFSSNVIPDSVNGF